MTAEDENSEGEWIPLLPVTVLRKEGGEILALGTETVPQDWIRQ